MTVEIITISEIKFRHASSEHALECLNRGLVSSQGSISVSGLLCALINMLLA